MENNTIKIRCSVRSNLFKKLCDMAGTIYYEKYDFSKFFLIITAEEVDKYRQHKNLNYY